MIAVWLSIAGLAVGAGMGLWGLINPRWAARIVRLAPAADLRGGQAEFRATYGGLFFGVHGKALGLVAYDLAGASQLLGVSVHAAAMGALAICAALWLWTAIGRGLSMALDGASTRYNAGSVVFETVIGLLIAAPWLAALAGR